MRVFGLGWGELLIVLIAIAVIYGLFLSEPMKRRLNGTPPPPLPPASLRVPPVTSASAGQPAGAANSAEEILAQRYARGELTDDEFIAKRNLLRQDRPA